MIRKRDLGRRKFIAEGAVGSVYRLTDFRLPGYAPLAYKEIKGVAPNELTPQARQQALDAMEKSVEFRARLSPADRADLDLYTTWPIDMVEENGSPCGLVMPVLSADFIIRTNPPTGPAEDVVFELSWLSAKESQAQVVGIDRSGIRDLVTRIALIAQLVYAVGRLHKHGAVYGDLSLKNVALATHPPRIKLLDCDAVAPLSDQTRVQLNSPNFYVPEIVSGAQKLQDDRTDIYKLGLCIIRGLQQGEGGTQAKNPSNLVGKLDPQAIEIITRAVGTDRLNRPTAKELFDALERNLLAKASPPTLHAAWLSRPALVRGQDVEVSWEASGAKEVRIQGRNGLDLRMASPGTQPAAFTVTPRASGEITVTVSNAHGTDQLVAGDVELYELPSFRVDVSPSIPVVIPALPAVHIGPVISALPPPPAVSTSGHPVPRIKLPDLTAVSELTAVMHDMAGPAAQLLRAAAVDSRISAAPRVAFDSVLPRPDLGLVARQSADSVHKQFDEARARLRNDVADRISKII